MTPQDKLKRVLRWLRKPRGASTHTASIEENGRRIANAGYHIPLQRSQTDDLLIPSSRRQAADCDSFSQSYDNAHPNGSKVARSMSLQPQRTKSSQQLSYREAVTVTCGADCPCDCHSQDSVQMYLTLCRCHMSGYESYRKAVYGGRGFVRRPPAEKHNLDKRKSMPDEKKFFGSADTLGSTNSGDTIKASSDYASMSGKSTGSSAGNKSHNSTSPFSLQQLNFSSNFRERELTLTQEHITQSPEQRGTHSDRVGLQVRTRNDTFHVN